MDRPSHEPNRCGPLSVPRPDCHGSRSVILCQRFSTGNTGSGLACDLPSVYPLSCQHGWILAKNSQQLMMSRTDRRYLLSLKKTLLAIGVNLTFVLRGQASNKWRVIYSPLIGTTLSVASLSLSATLVSDFMTFVRWRHKKQMWARFLLVSVFDRKPGRWSDWWHFVCLWTCSSLDLWSVSPLSKHLLRWGRCQIKVDTLMSLTTAYKGKSNQKINNGKAYQVKNIFWLTYNLWMFCKAHKTDKCVPSRLLYTQHPSLI